MCLNAFVVHRGVLRQNGDASLLSKQSALAADRACEQLMHSRLLQLIAVHGLDLFHATPHAKRAAA